MNKNTLIMKLMVTTLMTLSLLSVASADEARDIMEKVDQIQRNTAASTLTKARLSTCKFGKFKKRVACVEKARVKLMESVSKQLGVDNKDNQSISVLLEPASERGIGMLTYSYDDATKDTESWLYLSALGKVKRMASGTGEDQEPVSLFGSEFTTEDMETGKMDEYDFRALKEGPFGKRQVWVIEARPKPVRFKKTNYSKLLFWIDKERYISLKVQNYDKREKLLKKIIFRNIEEIDGFWIARDTTLMNVQTQRLSRMKNLEIAMGVSINEEFLTQRTLSDFAFRERELQVLRRNIQ